jgi:hypothetical protein
MDCTQDADMRPATAQIAIQGFTYNPLTWMMNFNQERSCSNDHAIGAVAALGSLLLDKCLLYWMQLSVFHQPFKGDDGGLSDISDSHLAGLLGLPSINYHAGTALLQATTELRTMQTQLIA